MSDVTEQPSDRVPRWAYLFEHPGAGADARWNLHASTGDATIVAVHDVEAALSAARELVDQGVSLVELCGGFPLEAVARVRAALPAHVAVGHVTFAADSLLAAADHARAAAAGTDG